MISYARALYDDGSLLSRESTEEHEEGGGVGCERKRWVGDTSKS